MHHPFFRFSGVEKGPDYEKIYSLTVDRMPYRRFFSQGPDYHIPEEKCHPQDAP
jgi:hypothetical protein